MKGLLKKRKANEPKIFKKSFNDFFDGFFDDFSLLSKDYGYDLSPKVNIYEDEKGYHLEAELPGAKKDEISLEIKGNYLQIKGEKKEEREESGKRFYLKESSYGSFERCFNLPEDLNQEKLEAELKNGVLKINIPKE